MGNCFSSKSRKVGLKTCKTCQCHRCVCLSIYIREIKIKNEKNVYNFFKPDILPYPREPCEDSDAASDYAHCKYPHNPVLFVRNQEKRDPCEDSDSASFYESP